MNMYKCFLDPRTRWHSCLLQSIPPPHRTAYLDCTEPAISQTHSRSSRMLKIPVLSLPSCEAVPFSSRDRAVGIHIYPIYQHSYLFTYITFIMITFITFIHIYHSHLSQKSQGSCTHCHTHSKSLLVSQQKSLLALPGSFIPFDSPTKPPLPKASYLKLRKENPT